MHGKRVQVFSTQKKEDFMYLLQFKMVLVGRVLMDAERVEWNVKSACNLIIDNKRYI